MTTINPDTVRQVANSLTVFERAVTRELMVEAGQGPSHMAATLGIPVRQAREVLRSLVLKGVAAYGTLWDDDTGLTAGRGYWLDSFGMAVRDLVDAELAEAPPADEPTEIAKL